MQYDYAYTYQRFGQTLDDVFIEINKMGADGWRLSHVFADHDDEAIFVMERVRKETIRKQSGLDDSR